VAVLEILRATPDRWARYRRVRLAALADAPDAFWSVLEAEAGQPEAFWRDRLADAERIAVIAVAGGADVGTMSAGPHHDGADDAGLYGVWVAPSARGGGAAELLLDHVIGWARDRGFRRLRLDVGDGNGRAIAFYRRCGFRPTGATSTFPAPRTHITEHELALDL
jgi:ribosomal protein S18 acetylase RimI-like enzyme